MAKSIKESYGPTQDHNSLTMLEIESTNVEEGPFAKDDDRMKALIKNKGKTKKGKNSFAKDDDRMKALIKKHKNKKTEEIDEFTEEAVTDWSGEDLSGKLSGTQLKRAMARAKDNDRKKREAEEKKKKKMGEEVENVDEATNKFPKWWEDTPKEVLTKVYHAKRQLPPKLDKKSWQKIVNALHDKHAAPLADYRKWSTMDPAKIQYNKESVGKVIGEDSIKVNGGSAVEIGKNERGSKTQYYWKDKSGLKNVFDTPQKLRYSLRNDANFSGAEKAVKQLLGEAKMGDIRRNVKKGTGPWTTVAIVDRKVVEQENSTLADHVPAVVKELKRRHPTAKISVEDKGGSVVHSESIDEGGINTKTRVGESFKNVKTAQLVQMRDLKTPKERAERIKELEKRLKAGDMVASAGLGEPRHRKKRAPSTGRRGSSDTIGRMGSLWAREKAESIEEGVSYTMDPKEYKRGGWDAKLKEYQKLMKKHGDSPASKIPPKVYMKIAMLGNELRKAKIPIVDEAS